MGKIRNKVSTAGDLQYWYDEALGENNPIFQIDTGTLGAKFIVPAGQKETVSANKTLDLGDVGVWQMVDTDAKIVTLPATAVPTAAGQYKIMNDGADGTVLLKVAPNASDKISGAGLTPADNKYIANTKATAKRGDYVILASDAVDGYTVVDMVGIWVRE